MTKKEKKKKVTAFLANPRFAFQGIIWENAQ